MRVDKILPYLYIAPFFVFFFTFFAFPFAYSIWLSFTRTKIGAPFAFVGLSNYWRLIHDDLFWNGLMTCIKIGLIQVPLNIGLSLLIALMLNTGLRGSRIFRTLIFLPVATSLVVAAIVWIQFYGTRWGLINQILRYFGLPEIDFLGKQIIPALVNVMNWRYLGWNVVIFLAGLSSLPTEVYESAKIDGAGRFRTFWYITLPLLKPTFAFILFFSIIGVFGLFAEPYVLTSGTGMHGQRARATETVAMYLYDVAFRYGNYGYSAAISWVLFIITFVLSFTLIKYVRIWEIER